VIRRLAFLTTLTASSVACDVANPTLAIRVEVSPVEIVAGGNGTATIRVTVVNLTAAPVERVLPCDNLYAVENAVGDLVVSNYRVTCPVENSIPLRIALGAFESVELTRLWTGVYVRYAAGGFETVALPPGSYRVYGAVGELRSEPQAVDLTAP